MIAFWINYSVSIHFHGKAMYIFPLAIQALPAILLCSCMLMCNESPRWLARQDRWEECKSVLARLRNLPPTHPYLEEEFQEIVDQLEHERQLIGEATAWNLQKEMWTIAGNRKRVLISIWLMIWQQMTGTNAINTYAPTIFKNLVSGLLIPEPCPVGWNCLKKTRVITDSSNALQGITGTSTSLFSTGVYGIVKTVSCTCFLLFMADSFGRRRSLLLSSVVQGICMFYIGLYVRISPPISGEPVPAQGYVALVCIFIFAA